MHICDVAGILNENGLNSPDLEMLKPNEARYRCLMMQPAGPIFAGKHRIGPLDLDEAGAKLREFLRLAVKRSVHLAITPEYFSPWDVIEAEMRLGTIPDEGTLWVLGCESIESVALDKFKAKVAEFCDVIYEPLEKLPADRSLLDPVVLLFQSKRKDGALRLVALVQFKTFPSRDYKFFEEGLLKRGTTVYKFRGACGKLSVSTIICSDAFALNDERVSDLIDRSTLIHIQLNPDPRNSTYRQYRKTAFEIDPAMSICHILCLNWAGSLVEHGEDGSKKTWPVVSGSAWYFPEARCKCDDEFVVPNHHLGVYYTYMHEKRHALLLHNSEAVFEFLVPKAVTGGRAILANLNGPEAQSRYYWNSARCSWLPAEWPTDSGFEKSLEANPGGRAALAHAMEMGNPLDIERLLALTSGSVNGAENWFTAKDIDSCKISADEVVRRVTVPQDDNDAAVDFRYVRLAAAAEVRYLLDTHVKWPPQLAGITKDASLQWTSATPNFNVQSADGTPALIVHVGGNGPPPRLENVTAKFENLLRKAGGDFQTRLCILYRQYGELRFARLQCTRFDDALGDETDILSVQVHE